MPVAKITFRVKEDFWKELQVEVNSYLKADVVQAGFRRLHRKAAFIVAWTISWYLALVIMGNSWWQIILYGVPFVLGTLAAAFCIMHDGNHGGFSRSRRVNRQAGYVLEVLGGSSYTWRVKHNLAHHTYPNFDGLDEDIDQPPFARMTSTQEWKPWYKWQHLYLWFGYGLLTLKWQSFGDISVMIRGRITRFELKKPSAFEAGAFAIGKLIFIGWAFVIPLLLHLTWHGALGFAIAYLSLSWLFSFILAATFQLAHCTDEAQFTSDQDTDSNGKLPSSWAVHQVLATSDFCPGNRAITWFMGGLNYQLEHHLFPHTAHVHYPAIAAIVKQACLRHGLPYNCQPTLWSAVKAHYRHLKNMGQNPAASPANA